MCNKTYFAIAARISTDLAHYQAKSRNAYRRLENG